MACGPLAQLRFLPTTTRSYAKAIPTALITHKLTAAESRQVRYLSSLMRTSWLFWCKNTSADTTFSKYCRYSSLTLVTSSLAFPPVDEMLWHKGTVLELLCFQSRCLILWDNFLGYCATKKQPRLFCLRLQDSVEFGHKITYIFEWEYRKHSQQLGVPMTVCSWKFSCSRCSGLKLSGKVWANISLAKMLSHPLLQRAGVLHS